MNRDDIKLINNILGGAEVDTNELNNLKKKVELICDGFFYEEKIANINEEIGKLNKKEEEK